MKRDGGATIAFRAATKSQIWIAAVYVLVAIVKKRLDLDAFPGHTSKPRPDPRENTAAPLPTWP